MDLKGFEYDFKQTMNDLIINSAEVLKNQIKQELGSDLLPCLEDGKFATILKLIDIKYFHAIAICSTLIESYHNALVIHINSQSSKV